MPADSKDVSGYFWRDGRKIAIVEAPDRFTVRIRRGVPSERVEHGYDTTHRQRLRRLDLDEFSVDSRDRDAVMARVRGGSEAVFASHVYSAADEPQTPLYLTDQLTVHFDGSVPDARIEAIAAEHGLELVKPVAGVERCYVFRVGAGARENPIKIANRIALEPGVLASEPNLAVASKAAYRPADTLYAEQWHLFNTGGPLLSTAAHMDVERAWDLTRGDRSVIVAVADDSCDTRHADFQGAGKIVFPRDFGGQDFEPLPELADDNHGTACCGVAVAEENGTGVVGVAPGCALMPIRTSGYIDDEAIEDLAAWVVDHDAAVLSCSWSAAARVFALSLRMRAALARAARQGRGGKGCVLVFAAGNENRPVDGTVVESGWPNNTPSGPTPWLNGFATHPDVMAVAASSSTATKSAYSNWGGQISVCAPSNNVGPATYPRVTVPVTGRGIVTTDRVGPSGYSSNDYTRTFGGTSSATPAVAGAAALVIAANPALTAAEVRQILEATADKIVDGSADPQLGNRFGSYDAAGHSPWFGFGRVNAFKAVTEARRRAGGATAGTTLKRSATPALPIPDDQPAGIRSELDFAEDAAIASLRVGVRITHTYAGDLRLVLGAPSGAQVVLHDRAGGSADNLRRDYTAETTPALSALAGQPVRGRWTLAVQDLAAIDTGTLDAWEIEITPRAGGSADVAEAPGLRIPDNQPAGIERTLAVGIAGAIADLEVALDITHSYIGDLRIALVAPDGTSVALHERAGGSADNLVVRWTAASLPALATLRGKAAAGTWRLRVVDAEAIDEGKLNRWGLRVTTQ